MIEGSEARSYDWKRSFALEVFIFILKIIISDSLITYYSNL